MNQHIIVVREAMKEDISQIAEIHRQVFSRQINSFEWIKCNFSAYPRIILYVVLIESVIVGYIQWIQKSGFRAEVVMELEQIAIKPLYQRHGLGQKLIKESLDGLKKYLSSNERILKNVLLTTRIDNPAQKIYENVLKAKVVGVIKNLYSNDEIIMIADVETDDNHRTIK